MGLDSVLVASLGGLDKCLQAMPPSTMRHYSSADLDGHTPIELFWHDPAVRSWYGSAAIGKIDKSHEENIALQKWWPRIQVSDDERRTIKHIWLAPNGAGKTTFTNTVLSVSDSDEMVKKLHLHEALHLNSKSDTMPRHHAIRDAFQAILVHQGYTGMTTQMDPSDFIPPHGERSYMIALHIVRPSTSDLTDRLRLRGWKDDKIIRRLQRFDTITEQLIKNKQFLSNTERSMITQTTTFML